MQSTKHRTWIHWLLFADRICMLLLVAGGLWFCVELITLAIERSLWLLLPTLLMAVSLSFIGRAFIRNPNIGIPFYPCARKK
jgi:hypothetical protein